MFKNSKETGGEGGTLGRVCQVWDKSRKGEKKSLPKRIKFTCRADSCNKTLSSQNMKRHLMEKHPDLWKAEPGNVRSKNDRQIIFFKINPLCPTSTLEYFQIK